MAKVIYKVLHLQDGSCLFRSPSPTDSIIWMRNYVLAHPEEVPYLSFQMFIANKKRPAFRYDGIEILGYLDDNGDILDDEEDD